VTTTLLLIHGLLAAALIGAITHQSLSLWWPPRAARGSFLARFRAVNVASYTNAIIIMFIVQAFVGGVLLYPSYLSGELCLPLRSTTQERFSKQRRY